MQAADDTELSHLIISRNAGLEKNKQKKKRSTGDPDVVVVYIPLLKKDVGTAHTFSNLWAN